LLQASAPYFIRTMTNKTWYYGKVLGYDAKGQPKMVFKDKSISEDEVTLNQFVTLTKHHAVEHGAKISVGDVDAWKVTDFTYDGKLWTPMNSLRELVTSDGEAAAGGGAADPADTFETWLEEGEEDDELRQSMGAVSLDQMEAASVAGIDGAAANLGGGGGKKTKQAARKSTGGLAPRKSVAHKKHVKKAVHKKLAAKK